MKAQPAQGSLVPGVDDGRILSGIESYSEEGKWDISHCSFRSASGHDCSRRQDADYLSEGNDQGLEYQGRLGHLRR